MFYVCYECDGNLIEQKGTIYGYWGEKKVKFTGLPKYQCNNCDEYYLDEEIAILIQEITRALGDTGEVADVVDIEDCYKVLIQNLDEVYDMLKHGKACFVRIGQTLIMNSKDVNSLFSKEKLSLAARNKDIFTSDVQREIDRLIRHD